MDKLLNQMKEVESIMKKVDSLKSGYHFECISRRLFCLLFTDLKLSFFPAFQERPKKIMKELSWSFKRLTKEPFHWTSKVNLNILYYFIYPWFLKGYRTENIHCHQTYIHFTYSFYNIWLLTHVRHLSSYMRYRKKYVYLNQSFFPKLWIQWVIEFSLWNEIIPKRFMKFSNLSLPMPLSL